MRILKALKIINQNQFVCKCLEILISTHRLKLAYIAIYDVQLLGILKIINYVHYANVVLLKSLMKKNL